VHLPSKRNRYKLADGPGIGLAAGAVADIGQIHCR
jgi:hypothetical protein